MDLPIPKQTGLSGSSLIDVNNLHELVERASQRLGNSIIIEASNFDLLAYSSYYREIDSARRETILSKRVPYHIVDHFKNSGITALLETTREPVRIPPIEEVGLSRRVVMAIFEENRLLGAIWVQETNRVLNETDFTYLKEIAKVAAQLIILSKESRVLKLEVKNQLLGRIIKGNFSNERLLKIELDLAGISVPSLYTIAIISSEFDTVRNKLRSLVQVFSTHASKSTYWIEDDENLIVIVGSPSFIDGSSIQLARDIINKVMDRVEDEDKTKIYLGIGKERTEIILARSSYLEALEVIDLAKKLSEHNIHPPQEYQALGIYRLLSLIRDKNKTDGYLNEHITQLVKHDLENNSELIPTLEAYLANNCKAKETSKCLHIHTNTLNYRLNRIYGVTGLNLEDFQVRVSTYIDLLIYRLG